MKIIFLFAMEEEAKVLDNICTQLAWREYKGFKLFEFTYNAHECVAIISGVGISLSGAAAALSIEKYNPDIIINIGLAGGINCKIGDIIISQSAIFHDADVTALGYPVHQLPDLPLQINSKDDIIELLHLKQFTTVKNAIIFSGNQFINNLEYVEQLKNKYKTAAAIEMEAASIGAICIKAKCNFLFIKKISDLADANAPQTFKEAVPNFSNKIQDIIVSILKAS